MQEDKERLTIWNVEPELISLANLDKWYLGEGPVQKVPTKAQLAESGIAPILEGWRPQRPLIGADTRVIGVGSCFARYFARDFMTFKRWWQPIGRDVQCVHDLR